MFRYAENASSRAGIANVTQKLECGPVAIVGLGGTGSYILDLVAKTPVKEIHLFDGDRLLQHNAFRAPGAPSLDTLRKLPGKAVHYRETYSEMRRNIFAHGPVTEDTVHDLQDMDFAFVAVDHGPSRKLVVDKLRECRIPFIDVGMGILEAEGSLLGQLRVTLWDPQTGDDPPGEHPVRRWRGRRVLTQYPNRRPKRTQRRYGRHQVEKVPGVLPGHPERGSELLPDRRKLSHQRNGTVKPPGVINHRFVHFIPQAGELEDGVVYVSTSFATAIHRCCCGCGNEVVTPFHPDQWRLTFDGETISLSPSIGNWGFDCQSHYWITRNCVVWAPERTDHRTESAKQPDDLLKREHSVTAARIAQRFNPSTGSAQRSHFPNFRQVAQAVKSRFRALWYGHCPRVVTFERDVQIDEVARTTGEPARRCGYANNRRAAGF